MTGNVRMVNNLQFKDMISDCLLLELFLVANKLNCTSLKPRFRLYVKSSE